MQIKQHIGILLITMLSLSTQGCSSSRKASQDSVPTPSEAKGQVVTALPQAKIYRTNSDYTNHVPVTLSNDGSHIVSYPAPQDVASANVSPIALDNGYLLDRRGVNIHTAYLDYSYEEYASLESTPSVDELMKHIIAKNAVSEIYILPITASEAIANPSRCNEFIANGFQNCKQIKSE